MPNQKPGKSKQDYGTPREFLDAVERRFGLIGWDLAATVENRVVPDFFSPEQDSLSQNWSLPSSVRVAWLNPEFADIDPWAAKCATVRLLRRWTLMLVPASVGAAWYENHVHDKAIVLGLRTRLTFVGETQPYPKDCILAAYGYGARGFDVWDWKASLAPAARVSA